jgi:hypothetical protein
MSASIERSIASGGSPTAPKIAWLPITTISDSPVRAAAAAMT